MQPSPTPFKSLGSVPGLLLGRSISGHCSFLRNATSLCSDPTNISGIFVSGVDLADVYKLVGGVWTLQGTAGYTLDKRTQNHPNELAIGVRLVFHFQAAAPINFFSVQAAQYATMCFAPYESGG